MAPNRAWFVDVLLASALLGGCSGAARKPPTTGASATPPAAASEFPDATGRRVRTRTLEFPIELSLPDKASWQISDGPTWLVAEHAASASRLAVRTWRADRLVRRVDCEAQARLARPMIPLVRDEAVVERRTLTAPAGFDTELVVGVEPGAQGISGYAIAIGAGVGRCYAAVFTTQVSSRGAEEEVAARLGLIVDRVLSGVRVRSVDERAVRHRLQVVPAGAVRRE